MDNTEELPYGIVHTSQFKTPDGKMFLSIEEAKNHVVMSELKMRINFLITRSGSESIRKYMFETFRCMDCTPCTAIQSFPEESDLILLIDIIELLREDGCIQITVPIPSKE